MTYRDALNAAKEHQKGEKSVKQIASEMGVNRKMLYYYWGVYGMEHRPSNYKTGGNIKPADQLIGQNRRYYDRGYADGYRKALEEIKNGERSKTDREVFEGEVQSTGHDPETVKGSICG